MILTRLKPLNGDATKSRDKEGAPSVAWDVSPLGGIQWRLVVLLGQRPVASHWKGARTAMNRRRGAARAALNHSSSQPSACPEIDCLRALLPRSVLEAAEHRALSIGLGADRVLIYADAISEEAYLNALATSLGALTAARPRRRVDCPLDDAKLIQATMTGLLPLNRDGRTIWIIAPHGLIARHLAMRDARRTRSRPSASPHPNSSANSSRDTRRERWGGKRPTVCAAPSR